MRKSKVHKIWNPPLNTFLKKTFNTGCQYMVHHVFRFDATPYWEVFQNEFRIREQRRTADSQYFDLLHHVNKSGAPLGDNTNKPTWVYQLLWRYKLGTNKCKTKVNCLPLRDICTRGINTNLTFGDLVRHPGQNEISFAGGIAPHFLRGAQKFVAIKYH